MSDQPSGRNQPAGDTRRLDLGVCGLGSIGRRHARLLAARPDVRLRVFDPAYDGSDALASGLDAVAIEPSFEALLADASDGIVIAVPDALHAPLTIQACRAGAHVLVEKPVADSVVAAREMERVAAACGVQVLVGHVLRHASVLVRARSLLHDGVIGTPLSFHATLGAYETLEMARMRFSEDLPYRLAFDYTHEWDYLQWLLGDVIRCAAVAHCDGDLPLLERPNVIDALLELESGATGSVHLDYVERDGARQVRIVGDRGVLEVDLRTGSLVARGVDGSNRTEHHAEHRDVGFSRQLDHFIDMIRTGRPAIVPISEARRALSVAEAIVAASEQGSWQRVESE